MADDTTDDSTSTTTEFDYLSNTKNLLGLTDETRDTILNVYISVMKQAILNYCNLSELPSALNYTLCSMSADFYRDDLYRNKIIKNESSGNIASITEDNRTVSFTYTNTSGLMTDANNRVMKTGELKRYRKLFRI